MNDPGITLGLGAALRLEPGYDGQLWRVFLDRPKGNVLDSEMIAGLHALFERARDEQHLKLVTIEGAGKHFSFGASIEEHLPERCSDMLEQMHAMFLALHESHVLCHALVRGQCLGGGLELAAFCHRVYAEPGASLGQPEIMLGVFAPVASAILPDRIGRGNAEDLCLSGRIIDAAEALHMGLVDELDADPWQAACDYFEAHLRPRSASSLRYAVRAMRSDFGARFRRRIRDLEHIYLDELMTSCDAEEGLTAFLEKREPDWRDE
jgi:cyclohexa-1,5-dienecarbonyl-CoA hydratase